MREDHDCGQNKWFVGGDVSSPAHLLSHPGSSRVLRNLYFLLEFFSVCRRGSKNLLPRDLLSQTAGHPIVEATVHLYCLLLRLRLQPGLDLGSPERHSSGYI